MATTPQQIVEHYLETYGDGARDPAAGDDLDRLVTAPPGLDLAGMTEALTDPRLQEPGNQPAGLQMMSDWMAPEGSLYYDAIFGDFHGQQAIRNWLIPAMAEISFIEFVPTQPGVLFADGAGGSSLDEWQMFANIGDERLPLSRGVSVRRQRDGWLTWACDVYDTGPFRIPPPPDMDVEAAPLPEWPRTTWRRDASVGEVAARAVDWEAEAEQFHSTDSVYHDPLFGEIRGRDAIRTWLSDVMPKVGDLVYEPLGAELDDGATTVQEWQQMAVQPDGSRVFMTRGTSVRRRVDGLVVYAADYFDTTSLMDDQIQAAAVAAGSVISADDIARHRTTP